MPDLATLGGMDCELIRGGVLAQPVNALSSLAFVVAGVWLLLRARRAIPAGARRLVAFGTLEIATGIGSLLYHGPMGWAAPFLHDSSFLLLLLLICVINVIDLAAYRYGHEAVPRWELTASAGVVPVAAISSLAPGLVDALAVGFVVAALVVETRLGRRLRLRAERRGVAISLGLFATAAVAYALGRTGSGWCEPAALLQFHAAWHVLVALAMAAYASATWGGGPLGALAETPGRARPARRRTRVTPH